MSFSITEVPSDVASAPPCQWTGWAKTPGESQYPEAWEGLELALVPNLFPFNSHYDHRRQWDYLYDQSGFYRSGRAVTQRFGEQFIQRDPNGNGIDIKRHFIFDTSQPALGKEITTPQSDATIVVAGMNGATTSASDPQMIIQYGVANTNTGRVGVALAGAANAQYLYGFEENTGENIWGGNPSVPESGNTFVKSKRTYQGNPTQSPVNPKVTLPYSAVCKFEWHYRALWIDGELHDVDRTTLTERATGRSAMRWNSNNNSFSVHYGSNAVILWYSQSLCDDLCQMLSADPFLPFRPVYQPMVWGLSGGGPTQVTADSTSTITTAGIPDVVIATGANSTSTITTSGSPDVIIATSADSTSTITTSGSPDTAVGGVAANSTSTITTAGVPDVMQGTSADSTSTITTAGSPDVSGLQITANTQSIITTAGSPTIVGTVQSTSTSTVITAGVPEITIPVGANSTSTITTAGSPTIAGTLGATSASTITTAGVPSLAIPIGATSTSTVTTAGSPTVKITVTADSTSTVTTAGDPDIGLLSVTAESTSTITAAGEPQIKAPIAADTTSTITVRGDPRIGADFDYPPLYEGCVEDTNSVQGVRR